METVSIEIAPHEGGWAVTFSGVTASVLPTRELAIAEANRTARKKFPLIWIHDQDGVTRARQAEIAIAETDQEETVKDVIVTEHIAVPANINGQDMRELQAKQQG